MGTTITISNAISEAQSVTSASKQAAMPLVTATRCARTCAARTGIQ